jgi:hypothetical protein
LASVVCLYPGKLTLSREGGWLQSVYARWRWVRGGARRFVAVQRDAKRIVGQMAVGGAVRAPLREEGVGE